MKQMKQLTRYLFGSKKRTSMSHILYDDLYVLKIILPKKGDGGVLSIKIIVGTRISLLVQKFGTTSTKLTIFKHFYAR